MLISLCLRSFFLFLYFLHSSIKAYASLPHDAKSDMKILRDTEIEQLASDYTTPLLKAANIDPLKVKIIILDNQNPNAFTDGYNIFINAGMFLFAKTPNELIGVLAHEIGHMAHRHILHKYINNDSSYLIAGIGALIGIGALSTGFAIKNSDILGAGTGLLLYSPSLAKRRQFHHSREDETSADRSALTFLKQTQQSAKGFLNILNKFDKMELSSHNSLDMSYLSTHPFPHDRIRLIKDSVQKSSFYYKKDAPSLILRHMEAQAKIKAYFASNKRSLIFFLREGSNAIATKYGLSLYDIKNNSNDVSKMLNFLLEKEPKNPFFYETYGNFYFKKNNYKKADFCYRKAVKYAKKPSALLYFNIAYNAYKKFYENPDETHLADEIIFYLKKTIHLEPKEPFYYQILADIYKRKGDKILENLSFAEMYYYIGNYYQAYNFAVKVTQKLKPDSPYYLQAKDIIEAIKTLP